MAIKELFNDARPQVLFDPRASQRIDPRFKFTRDGVASYYDSQGILRYAPANQPRVGFNYEPAADGIMRQAEGLYVEGQYTNPLKLSDTWGSPNANQGNDNSRDRTGATFNAGTAPDLSNTAVLLNNTGAGINFSMQGFTEPGTIVTFSTFLKQYSTYDSVWITGVTGIDANINFNFSTETITVGFFPAYVAGSAGYHKLANGWYRFFFSYDRSKQGGSLWPSISSSEVGYGVYVWGAQKNKGTLLLSYISTGASAVTQPADLLTIETPLPATGSIYIDARSLVSDVDTTLLSAAPASPSTDKLALAIREPASLYDSKALVYEVDGEFKPTLPFPVPSNAQERNLITYGANNYHYRSDSARYTPSSSDDVPANMTRLGIGHDVVDPEPVGGPSTVMTGYISAVYLWPGEITPTVAEALVRGDVDPKDADAGVFTPAAGSLAFVFNTQGTATDGNTVVQLPLRGSTNNVLVDWGDNTSSSLIGAAASVTVNHTYTSAGIYPVQITADDDGTNSGLQDLQFFGNSPADLVRVLQWGGSTTFNPTTMYRIFRDCTQLDFENDARTNLPDTSGCSDWREAFYNCSSLSGQYPDFDHSGATLLTNAWFGCSSITTFGSSLDDLNTAGNFVTNYSGAWAGCSSITSFPTITIPNDQGDVILTNAWKDCSNLSSFPVGIDTSAVTNFDSAWRNCTSLTSFPLINTAAGTKFASAWRNGTSLTSFPIINTAAGTDFANAWRYCTSLTSFPLINTAAGTNFSFAWGGCTSLTSFPLINTAAGTNFAGAWGSCSSLTSFPSLNMSAAVGLASDASNTFTGFRETWRNCTSLTDFPANRFDSTTCTRFLDAFRGCALTAQSIENILVSINTAGTSNGNLSLEDGTNANTSTWSTAANNAYIALVGRGWTITQNGTAPS